MWLIALLACGEKEQDTAQIEQSEPVTATLRLLSVTSGQAIPNIEVSSTQDSSITGDDGRGTVTVDANALYTIRTSDNSSMDHLYQGMAGTEDFEVVGFLVDRSTTNMVFSMMGVSQSSDKGIVVAALDEPDLSPAVGASAELNGGSDGAFIFGATSMPESGNSIVQGGSSFVFFPNVEPGTMSLEAFGAEGTSCVAYPSGDSQHDVVVEADAVSIVVFSCE